MCNLNFRDLLDEVHLGEFLLVSFFFFFFNFTLCLNQDYQHLDLDPILQNLVLLR